MKLRRSRELRMLDALFVRSPFYIYIGTRIYFDRFSRKYPACQLCGRADRLIRNYRHLFAYKLEGVLVLYSITRSKNRSKRSKVIDCNLEITSFLIVRRYAFRLRTVTVVESTYEIREFFFFDQKRSNLHI